MTTNNLISTPNITGNIGSCKSELTQVYSNVGLLTSQGVNVVTNSCTGKVDTTSFEEVSHVGVIGGLTFSVIVFFTLIAMIFN